MKLFREIEKIGGIQTPVSLTIGYFDGVHKGHLEVLRRLKEVAQSKNQPAAVISFENHPASILKPEMPSHRLSSNEQKIRLLEDAGVDILLLLKFTWEFSQQTPEYFLKRVHGYFPFSSLVLGHDSAFGKDRQGDRLQVRQISSQLNFELEYVEPFTQDGLIVSSSIIKVLIQEGKYKEAENMLGRSILM